MKPTLFYCLKYADANAAIDFLTAIGFTEVAVYRNQDDPRRVDHAELHWGKTGGLMFGSAQDPNCSTEPSGGSCYLVVPTDADVDAAYRRALKAGATSVREPADQHYGGREAGVLDPEGNGFSFGSYPGADA